MAKAEAIPGLDEEVPYALAAARVVSVRTRELIEQAAGVLDTDDIERVHDMRVASRRLRAALEVFEPCFPRDAFEDALRDVKDLADALGERRDRDVTIAALTEVQAAMGAAERAGIAGLIEALRAEQHEANQALAPYVTEGRLAGLRDRLEHLAAQAEALAPPTEPPSLRVVA
ncbi:MAG: CHAD domain-containing protein [Solirubrobacterales bacterium]